MGVVVTTDAKCQGRYTVAGFPAFTLLFHAHA
jgi:hypothetical protein